MNRGGGRTCRRIAESIGVNFLIIGGWVRRGYSRDVPAAWLDDAQSDALIAAINAIGRFKRSRPKRPISFFLRVMRDSFKKSLRIECRLARGVPPHYRSKIWGEIDRRVREQA